MKNILILFLLFLEKRKGSNDQSNNSKKEGRNRKRGREEENENNDNNNENKNENNNESKLENNQVFNWGDVLNDIESNLSLHPVLSKVKGQINTLCIEAEHVPLLQVFFILNIYL